MPKMEELTEIIYPRLRKSEGLLFWILHNIMEIICCSANFRTCNMSMYSFVFKSFIFIVILLSCRPG